MIMFLLLLYFIYRHCWNRNYSLALAVSSKHVLYIVHDRGVSWILGHSELIPDLGVGVLSGNILTDKLCFYVVLGIFVSCLYVKTATCTLNTSWLFSK